jgi:hypothetical protein
MREANATISRIPLTRPVWSARSHVITNAKEFLMIDFGAGSVIAKYCGNATHWLVLVVVLVLAFVFKKIDYDDDDEDEDEKSARRDFP